ncbi:MAG: DNA glycosylase AlkZ-like family protein [Gaiellaceae bacterium]
MVDGMVAGSWKFERGRIRLEPFRRLDKATRKELDEEAGRLAEFHA